MPISDVFKTNNSNSSVIEYKVVLGILSSIIALGSTVPYVIDIFHKRTRPHIFSWLIWSLLTATAFAAQLSEDAGMGAWATGGAFLDCFIVFILAFWYGEKHFTFFDKISLCGALLALASWWLTSEPLIAVILVSLTDVLGYLPTFRKGFEKPHEETAITYVLGTVAFTLGILALESYTLTTWLYPACTIVMNSLLVILLLYRRKVVIHVRVAKKT